MELSSDFIILAQHERDILAGVSAARLWASQVETSTSYYDTYGPAKQTLDSFNHFMKVDLPLILMTNGYFQHDDVIDARQGRMVSGHRFYFDCENQMLMFLCFIANS